MEEDGQVKVATFKAAKLNRRKPNKKNIHFHTT
jgi:hypothetical protein